jgi:hypothetical protein
MTYIEDTTPTPAGSKARAKRGTIPAYRAMIVWRVSPEAILVVPTMEASRDAIIPSQLEWPEGGYLTLGIGETATSAEIQAAITGAMFLLVMREGLCPRAVDRALRAIAEYPETCSGGLCKAHRLAH